MDFRNDVSSTLVSWTGLMPETDIFTILNKLFFYFILDLQNMFKLTTSRECNFTLYWIYNMFKLTTSRECNFTLYWIYNMFKLTTSRAFYFVQQSINIIDGIGNVILILQLTIHSFIRSFICKILSVFQLENYKN